MLKRLSHDSYECLRQLKDFSNLSFAFPASHLGEEESRKTASKLVGSLKGQWKFNYGGDVNYFIIPSKTMKSPFAMNIDNVLKPVLSGGRGVELCPWLTLDTRYRIAELYSLEYASRSKRKSSLPSSVSDTLLIPSAKRLGASGEG